MGAWEHISCPWACGPQFALLNGGYPSERKITRAPLWRKLEVSHFLLRIPMGLEVT